MKARILIVDKNDEVIGSKVRDTLKQSDIYRVSALWVTNSKGQVLLARRHRNKTHHPRMWGPAVAGTVEEEETYHDNIKKEAQEELGIKDISFTKGPKILTSDDYNHFTQWYTVVIDKDASDFVIQEDEVEEVGWFYKDELKLDGEFIPKMRIYLELFE